jgi:hypothetical protein
MLDLPAHPFPLIRSGGLFLILVGTAIVLGGLVPRRRGLLLAAGGVVAAAVVGLSAGALTRPLGWPTRAQILSLLIAVAFEIAAIVWVRHRLRSRGERTAALAILFVVGLHFLPMGVAFGPVIAVLGLATAINSAAGLRLFRAMPLQGFWLADGGLKIAAGALMFWFPPNLAWG